VPSRIKLLDEFTINKIAAGEVVERPASVVKELIENSLDSGASSVSVSVEDGGRRSITVRDDGCGMSLKDAEMSFQRHATSKIATIEDLQTLGSYGFRGEALSSIAAVAKVRLRTREHDANEGTEVVLEAGKVVLVSPIGCPAGTEVTVEDLFYNVPARRKALKSKAVELSHCRGVVQSYILSRPGLSFSLHSDGEIELVHVPAEGMKGSLASVFGSKVADNMLFGQAEGEDVRAEAYLGRLEHTKSSPGDLKLFVKNRPIRSPKLVSAVVGAYGSRLMKDRYPVGVLRIFIEGSGVDVNVHPSKREVRFLNEAEVVSIVSRSVQNALQEPDLSYKYDLTKFAESFRPPEEIPESSKTRAAQAFLEVRDSEEHKEPPAIIPLAQIMTTYILAESKGNLLLVDQHAASERVMYESILHAIDTGAEVSQTLLTPLVLNLTSSEQSVLEENREPLEKAGFKVEPFGKSTFALRSIPTVLGVAQGESALRNILGDLGQMSEPKKLGLEVIWRVACHTAIRAGDPLSQGQMRQLLSELMRTENPYTCEHGRPTMIVLSPSDLEKLFKRRL
jgi:DNA mismatch repair protein MutL